MKVENSYVNNQYSGVGAIGKESEVKQTEEEQRESQEMIDQGVSMVISRRGFAMATQELEVYDAHEVYNMRMALTSGNCGISSIVDGSFVGKIAEQYKSMADDIREKYSGKEYDHQMMVLNSAYNQANELLTEAYTRQMRILSGDIVINREVRNYSSAEEAQRALERDDWGTQETVISKEMGEQISNDVKSCFEAAKKLVMSQGFFDWKSMQDVWAGSVWNVNDLQKMGTFFLDKKHQSDISGVSAFAGQIITDYLER